MIFDTHAHLDLLGKTQLTEVIKRAESGRVKVIITNSVDLNSCKKNLEISKQNKIVKFAAGLYPKKNLRLADYKNFEKFVEDNKNKIVAIGEIGLDLFHTKNNFEIQIEIFKKQLDLAEKLNLPVIIHTRKAEKEVLGILENYKNLKIILHCFSGSFKLIKKADEMGCYFSIPANIVFSEHFQKMAKELPWEKILTETDTPYLSPYKEIKNEPAFIRETINILSKIWEISEEKVESIIEKNFKKVFPGIFK
jgi:TatD DNase family protein